jgi:hypothetical protein
MSVNKRTLWIVPAALVASWLAVRSLAALPALELDDPQPSFALAGHAIVDPSLARLIGRFAAEARDRE